MTFLNEVAVAADSGFHNAANVQWLYESGIDGYLADKQLRKRDARYAGAERHYTGRALWGNDRSRLRSNRFRPKDFDYDAKTKRCRCPTGQKMYIGVQGEQGGRHAIRYQRHQGRLWVMYAKEPVSALP